MVDIDRWKHAQDELDAREGALLSAYDEFSSELLGHVCDIVQRAQVAGIRDTQVVKAQVDAWPRVAVIQVRGKTLTFVALRTALYSDLAEGEGGLCISPTLLAARILVFGASDGSATPVYDVCVQESTGQGPVCCAFLVPARKPRFYMMGTRQATVGTAREAAERILDSIFQLQSAWVRLPTLSMMQGDDVSQQRPLGFRTS